MFTKMHSQEFHVKSDLELNIFIKWLNFYIHKEDRQCICIWENYSSLKKSLGEMDMELELLSEEGIAGTFLNLPVHSTNLVLQFEDNKWGLASFFVTF